MHYRISKITAPNIHNVGSLAIQRKSRYRHSLNALVQSVATRKKSRPDETIVEERPMTKKKFTLFY